MTTQATHVGGEEWADLAHRRVYDPGAHGDALARAREGIETHRKRDVALRLVDGAGRPLAHRTVHVEQRTHAFPFGDNLWSLDRWIHAGMANQDRVRMYTRHYRDCLNAANALCYWTERPRCDGPKTEDEQGHPRMDVFWQCVDWARANELQCKGHALFWSIPKCVPEWVKRYDLNTQWAFAEVRVRDLVAGARGRITMWDVVNEALWEPAFKNLAQRAWPHIESTEDMAEYVGRVIGWARSEDPDACYVLNDYGMTDDRGRTEPLRGQDGSAVTAARQRERMLALVERLGDDGRAPNAIGMQSHVGGWQQHADQMAIYDQMGALGVPVHITEFWAHRRELEAQGMPEEEQEQVIAAYVSNYLTCAFGHPAVEAFFFWGFLGQALRFGKNPNDLHSSGVHVMPVYDAVRRLIRETWHTDETLDTDAEGCLRFRGFLGGYAARTVPATGGPPVGVRFDVARGGHGTQTLRVV